MVDVVADLLNKNNITYIAAGRDYKIHCLNPEHEDSNPSLRVDKVTGAAHCFSCGWKANIFVYLNASGYMLPARMARLKEKLKELKTSHVELKYPDNVYPFTESYRGISASTYKKFEAFTTDSDPDLEDRIIFPIRSITGDTLAFIGRHSLSNAEPRYYITPRHVAIPPYPLVVNRYKPYAILVEGLFDMLNLVDKGLENVVCCFGTSTLRKQAKNKLLPLQAQGIKKIYILFDGDKPGREAATTLKPVLEEAGYFVEVIDLPDDEDPGSLTQEYVDYLIRYINENSGN